MEYAFFISALIGMSTEIVTLSLNQVSRQDCRTVAVVVGNGGRECRNRDTVLNGISHNITQRLLIFISNLLEVRRQQQVGDTRILLVSISDLLQELSTNNTTGTEDFGNLTVVQIPVVFIRCSTQLREALSIRNDLAQIQSATNFLYKLSLVTSRLRFWPRQDF